MSSNTENLKNQGKYLLENTDILSKRYQGNITDYAGFTESLLKYLIDEFYQSLCGIYLF